MEVPKVERLLKYMQNPDFVIKCTEILEKSNSLSQEDSNYIRESGAAQFALMISSLSKEHKAEFDDMVKHNSIFFLLASGYRLGFVAGKLDKEVRL